MMGSPNSDPERADDEGPVHRVTIPASFAVGKYEVTFEEWEYVARAGTTTPFHTGEQISTSQANYDGDYTYNGSSKGENRKRTIPVGSFGANQFGLHDVHGNVGEWVEDCQNDNYKGAPSDGSAWTTGDCEERVVRGGSWLDSPGNLRSSLRYWYRTGKRNRSLWSI